MVFGYAEYLKLSSSSFFAYFAPGNGYVPTTQVTTTNSGPTTIQPIWQVNQQMRDTQYGKHEKNILIIQNETSLNRKTIKQPGAYL